jgi:tetratricopeptide (TPR) repeat protein
MAKQKWADYPFDQSDFKFSGDALKKAWAALHAGDCEAFPKDGDLVDAWRHYHMGDFGQAVEAGLAVGLAGYTVANKAAAMYATYIEKKDAAKLKFFQEVMERAEEAMKKDAKNPNAYYLYAYSAGRYSQGISIVKALSQGYGGKIKTALETALKLEPKHADAHTAMGAYHAEIIDKVGSMVGGLTYGAKKEKGVEHYEKALKLAPKSPITHIEYANGLLMMFPGKEDDKATDLYVKASEMKPRDAVELLDVEAAKAELED